ALLLHPPFVRQQICLCLCGRLKGHFFRSFCFPDFSKNAVYFPDFSKNAVRAGALLVWLVKAWPSWLCSAFSFACYQMLKADDRRGCAAPPSYDFGTDAIDSPIDWP